MNESLPIVEMKRISISFPGVKALDGVDFRLFPGEVHTLMGENGAGKSTLIKALTGVYKIDDGEILISGVARRLAGTSDAQDAGISTVYQEVNLCSNLTIGENVMLGHEKRGAFGINWRATHSAATDALEKLGLGYLNPRQPLSTLSIAMQQLVAISRAMVAKSKVLILDEPTSSLSSAEADRLFELVDRLRARGVAILYISHRMSDIRRLADSIVSLRDGRIAGLFEGETLDYEGAVNAMLGQKISLSNIVVRDGTAPVFTAENLTIARGAKPFSLTLGDGEVVAITGLVGVGKTALAETLFGARTPVSGSMMLDGRAYAPKTTRAAIDQGVFLVAKDRGDSGIVPDFNIYENVSLPFLKRISNFGISNRRAERAQARQQISALGIVCRTERDEMNTLSGGNQQKVMVGRWLSQASRLLILDEPFQGVDISARRDIAAKLRASASGRATIVFLTELDEAFEIADRILVMSEHTLVGEHRNAGINVDRLLAEIAGHHEMVL